MHVPIITAADHAHDFTRDRSANEIFAASAVGTAAFVGQ
jgi:hypothetical protein